MTALPTTFTDEQIDQIRNVFSELYDELVFRNAGDWFKSRTVDLLGRANDAFKILHGETEEVLP